VIEHYGSGQLKLIMFQPSPIRGYERRSPDGQAFEA
jgi:hypothetical protein